MRKDIMKRKSSLKKLLLGVGGGPWDQGQGWGWVLTSLKWFKGRVQTVNDTKLS